MLHCSALRRKRRGVYEYCTFIQLLGYDLVPMNDLQEQAVNAHEWTWKCAETLHRQWPRVDRVNLENIAEALLNEDRWKSMEPSEAAVQWLSQGAPHSHRALTVPVNW